ncbi:hypothetical protein PYV00_02040, partial [Novosphingobium sp. H3SJ31-1]|nr:hypothetical protein [Novosphingobium album (ex Liu et al. 2023)]
KNLVLLRMRPRLTIGDSIFSPAAAPLSHSPRDNRAKRCSHATGRSARRIAQGDPAETALAQSPLLRPADERTDANTIWPAVPQNRAAGQCYCVANVRFGYFSMARPARRRAIVNTQDRKFPVIAGRSAGFA